MVPIGETVVQYARYCTLRTDIDRIKARLKRAEQEHKDWIDENEKDKQP